jgi:hypothetical protein
MLNNKQLTRRSPQPSPVAPSHRRGVAAAPASAQRCQGACGGLLGGGWPSRGRGLGRAGRCGWGGGGRRGGQRSGRIGMASAAGSSCRPGPRADLPAAGRIVLGPLLSASCSARKLTFLFCVAGHGRLLRSRSAVDQAKALPSPLSLRNADAARHDGPVVDLSPTGSVPPIGGRCCGRRVMSFPAVLLLFRACTPPSGNGTPMTKQ